MIQTLKKKYPDTLEYHRGGKLEIIPTKSLESQNDLSMAYTPGVAIPCKEIEKDKNLAYDYTTKGNLVAVISNGSAVLGLGDIGALASKPVMEGKAVLFKKFAGINSIDIEIDEKNPEKLVEIIKAISPSFGGINLEDIKAPECFYIEERLIEECDIPVMHDDQHGTAIITSAAMLNALEISGKKIEELKVVIIGAGAAAIASAKMYKHLGIKNLIMFDSKGAITKVRDDLNKYKAEFAIDCSRCGSLAEAISGADMVLGLSKADVIDKEMVKSLNQNPIIFALSNPVPEILPEVALSVRSDILMATGRSDYPNQVNNVLGFPYIFRGALAARSKKINMEMKVAAIKALASLAKEDVPKEIEKIHKRELSFGRDYLIPSPFDPRLKDRISDAIKDAAIASGVSRI